MVNKARMLIVVRYIKLKTVIGYCLRISPLLPEMYQLTRRIRCHMTVPNENNFFSSAEGVPGLRVVILMESAENICPRIADTWDQGTYGHEPCGLPGHQSWPN
ncbi:predicted protein [Lichtheimia corymbifera JMRC:FSU:9682]|uniref:Uncharacterized protein n=1 Tax=Lichtheimia corymbifera JMRC:FSU:9682 TaxID=1263082 RepID=A0A068S8D4_9FUNG|nr:predicted protein [Lichtheimia corymbifera JMRC:FSU:9682]